MGQAWCKERTTKAQDSKSPLDRVFVRCAHQIYPTLKQDGSVLGGATQRVTSSEIGYAGSPPREALTRGESVDSIDRPFHPSEWVDVNLEVPSTPSSVITNLTTNTSLYQTTTTLSSTVSNLKNVTPIPPPRRRQKNRGRPLPPKPDEVVKTHGNVKQNVKETEPVYSSVKRSNLEETSKDQTKNRDAKGAEKDDEKIRVNGAEKIAAITEVTDGDKWTTGVPGEHRVQLENRDRGNSNEKEKEENRDLEYEKFSKGTEDLRKSSTPKNTERESSSWKDVREFVSKTIMENDDLLDPVYHRSKNYSTVSLPNYDELEVVKKEVEREDQESESDIASPKKSGRTRNISTMSLPDTEIVESLPPGSTDRLEKYMTRCRSFGDLQPHEILDKLKAQSEQIDSSDEDEWGGLDDWDLGVVEYLGPSDGRSPLVPNSRLRERKDTVLPKFIIGGSELVTTKKKDVPEEPVFSQEQNKQSENALSIPRNSSFEIPKSPNSLKSALKRDATRKISMPAKFSSERSSSPLEEWFSGQERSVRFFDSHEVDEEYANTPGHRPAKPSGVRKDEEEYDNRRYPFNGLETGAINIDNFFEPPGDFGGTKSSNESPGPIGERARNLTRSLSNESEPFDGYEEKELTLDIRSQQSSSIGKLSRTISDESIPPEMEDGNESLVGIEDGKNGSQDFKTPPSSPEPKILAEILGGEHFLGGRSSGLKIQREDEGESNLSSMTPSLTELEAALSDMLEKEDRDEPGQNVRKDSGTQDPRISDTPHALDDKPIEPRILPNPKDRSQEEEGRKENTGISLGVILNEKEKEKEKVKGKNPFEDSDDEEDLVPGFARGLEDSKIPKNGSGPVNPFDNEPPEKPSRLYKVPLDQNVPETPEVPMPPQRKNKQGASSPTIKVTTDQDGDREFPIGDPRPHPNDRLI